MNPAGKIRGRENMMPAYIGQPAGHEKGSATALSPPRSAMFSLKPVGRRTNSDGRSAAGWACGGPTARAFRRLDVIPIGGARRNGRNSHVRHEAAGLHCIGR
jgi:hypothetical protein